MANIADFCGTWYFRGKPCTVALASSNTVHITDFDGSVGTGQVSGDRLHMEKPGFYATDGVISSNGQQIAWSNREFWTRTPK